ncbi:helix-turn-helix transcriptional regulator [Brytella acorum]|uniref:helix-turn-helix transcriptional regulator n=1 Tax=Brytella acorum TaxID=2959299 RepID=UPI0025AE310C|nr:helix-turn-helix domain-containing protein [Brytella acorum]MDF3625949.1 helix-turn-helix domain-containing protein [Brytella acorum]
MIRLPDSMPPRLLRTTEAAHFLGLSGRTLEKHRTMGTGPIYHKIGGRVVYTLADLTAWLEAGARRCSGPQGEIASRRAGENA